MCYVTFFCRHVSRASHFTSVTCLTCGWLCVSPLTRRVCYAPPVTCAAYVLRVSPFTGVTCRVHRLLRVSRFTCGICHVCRLRHASNVTCVTCYACRLLRVSCVTRVTCYESLFTCATCYMFVMCVLHPLHVSLVIHPSALVMSPVTRRLLPGSPDHRSHDQ